jgi:hypothetical protein
MPLIRSNAQEHLRKGGEDLLRVVTGGEEAVEIAVPPYVRARANEIAQLSRRLGDRGSGFRSASEVFAPALVYGLAHMQERYRQAALREGADSRTDRHLPAVSERGPPDATVLA